MTASRFILASLRHYRRIHVAVALGVAVATAVLTGALVVGDSVRGSLRDLTLERLGYIDSALVTGHMFRAALADELAADANFQQHFTAAEPAILMSGTLQSGSGNGTRRATAISIIGCRNSFGDLRYGKFPSFWTAVAAAPPNVPKLVNDEIALTEPIANELGVEKGDSVLVRIPVGGSIPADSPLGEKTETSIARQFKVKLVLGRKGQARFGLFPSQHEPRNAFVPLTTLQSMLGNPDRANTILVDAGKLERASGESAQTILHGALRPQLADYGLRVEQISSPVPYVQISADQLVLPDEVVRAAERAFRSEPLQPVITYLANTLVVGEGENERKIPYSTITGVDSTNRLGPLLDERGTPVRLADDEIALNDWAAKDLQAQTGDLITVIFYEPESAHGQLREHQPPPVFKLRTIVPLENSEGQTTAAADPKLTPELPGVTDQKSINDWDLPFELVENIRPQDEDYWDEHRTTPKAFVSLATAKRLWPSRWGTISLLRFPVGESLRDSPRFGETRPHDTSAATRVSAKLLRELDPAALGMVFQPVKQQGLEAASGTTPFDALFLAFSFFLIAAGLMLIALLFQLGIEQRAAELGTLAAVGVGRTRVASLLSREGLVVAAVGAAVGTALGVLYAWLMIVGLRTWWLAATATPFLELHVLWPTLVVGWLMGVAVSWITIRLSIRRLVRQSPTRLLAGSAAGDGHRAQHGRSPDEPRLRIALWPTLRITLAALTIALVAIGFYLQSEAQAGVFFASGTAMLILLLGELRYRLRRARRRTAALGSFSLWALSALNTARNPGRSTLTVGLVATASFLIVAVSAFRLETSDAGTGGFDFLATSDQPIHYDLNTAEGRLELGFSDRASEELEAWAVYSLRLAGGEDASCLNLYRPTQPRVLGVPDAIIARGGFAWSATAEGYDEKPWSALKLDLGSDERGEPIVPVVIDASTAIYSLHLKGVGDRLTIRDAADRPVTLQVVGLLKNSVLQGNLLVSEANFLRLFPDTGGYRYFLIERAGIIAGSLRDPESGDRRSPAIEATEDVAREDIAQVLESTLGDEGFDVVDAREQLAAYLAVQNTYLSTFQSLGALGLLLGTIGLAVVQLRSVLERRGELALMRAGGFPRSRLVRMVVWENAVLLIGGLAIGCVAAVVALIPQWAPQQASVPWTALAMLLGTIVAVGVAAGWLATRSALRAPIVPALRGD